MSKFLRSVIISAIACFVAVSISVFSQPAQSQQATTLTSSQSLQMASAALHEAESVLIAQGMEPATMTRYVAVLTQGEVTPTAPATTYAFGAAGAVLVGDRLVVRGDFSNLTSPLRDYATDPLNPPNPNITSGVHIHQGAPTGNGPFQYALQVSPSESGLQGRFMGEYTLTSEQRQALADGMLYVDLHTKQNRAGELRGIFKSY